MIEGRAETLEEWYQILKETVDKYNVLIGTLILPVMTQENEDTYDELLLQYKKKHSMYLEAQKLSKYYLELKN
jgi:hypothetical protein